MEVLKTSEAVFKNCAAKWESFAKVIKTAKKASNILIVSFSCVKDVVCYVLYVIPVSYSPSSVYFSGQGITPGEFYESDNDSQFPT